SSKESLLAGWPVSGVGMCLVGGLGVLSWGQGKVWHDSEKLWTHVLAMDPQSSIAENNLGVARAGERKLAEAVEHYQRALQIRPEHAGAHYNLGNALARQGKLTEAIEHYQQAVHIKPDDAHDHNNLGNALARQGKLTEAIVHY